MRNRRGIQVLGEKKVRNFQSIMRDIQCLQKQLLIQSLELTETLGSTQNFLLFLFQLIQFLKQTISKSKCAQSKYHRSGITIRFFYITLLLHCADINSQIYYHNRPVIYYDKFSQRFQQIISMIFKNTISFFFLLRPIQICTRKVSTYQHIQTFVNFQSFSMNQQKEVLVTVGTTLFQGLIKHTDTQQFVSLLAKCGYKKIIYQIGKGKYEPTHGDYFRLTPHINQYYDRANLLITHGGAGTLLQNLHKGKIVIAIANEELSGNHQTQLIQILDSQGYILGFSSINNFLSKLSEVENFIKQGPAKKFQRPERCILNQIIFQQKQNPSPSKKIQ